MFSANEGAGAASCDMSTLCGGGLIVPADVGGRLLPGSMRLGWDLLRPLFQLLFFLPAFFLPERTPCPLAGGRCSAMIQIRLCFPIQRNDCWVFETDASDDTPCPQGQGLKMPFGLLDSRFCAAYLPTNIAPSSNGKTTVSDTVYRGSNPCGASTFSTMRYCGQLFDPLALLRRCLN